MKALKLASVLSLVALVAALMGCNMLPQPSSNIKLSVQLADLLKADLRLRENGVERTVSFFHGGLVSIRLR